MQKIATENIFEWQHTWTHELFEVDYLNQFT